MPPQRHSIWNSAAEIPSSTKVRPPCRDDSSTSPPEASPEQEAARMAALKRLRHKMVTLCAKHQNNTSGGKPPTLAMERWLSRESLKREVTILGNADDTAEDNDCKDPILPSSGIADNGLTKDLSRNIDHSAAKAIAETLASDAKAAVERISKLSSSTDDEGGAKNQANEHMIRARAQLKTCTKAVKKASKQVQKNLSNSVDDEHHDESDSSSPNLQQSLTALHKATQQLDEYRQTIQRIQDVSSGKNIAIDNSRRPGICDVMLLQPDGTRKKPYLTISTSHFIKFVQLWQFQRDDDDGDPSSRRKYNQSSTTPAISPKSIAQNPTKAIQEMPDGSRFLRYLYCCLSRYEMIKGAGYQCAMPPVAFDAACHQLGLGTTIECFASPFNCRYRQYCSAFPDLEAKFGSLGSFFDDDSFFPWQGSFEANPPFVPEIMYQMNQKLQRLLDNPKAKELSFLVIVPAWGAAGIGYVEELEASEYCVARSRVAAADHSFCDGAQHKALKQELRPSSWDTAAILLQNQAGSTRWPVSQEKLDSVFCAALRSSKTRSSLAEWEGRGVGKGGSGKVVASAGKKRPFGSSSSTFRGKKTRF